MRNVLVNPLDHEVAEEKAAGLSRTEQRLLGALAAYRGVCASDRPRHERATWDLVEAVTFYVVQREACGLRDSRQVCEFYRVPAEVVARIGARRPRS